MSAATTSLATGEGKAATVLAGSVIEALLLWVLQQPVYQAKAASAVTALVSGKLLDYNPGDLEKMASAPFHRSGSISEGDQR